MDFLFPKDSDPEKNESKKIKNTDKSKKKVN